MLDILACIHCGLTGGFHERVCHSYAPTPEKVGPGNSKDFMAWRREKNDAEAKHVFIHGPRTKSDPRNCEKCNYDDHTCPGCGEWLHHGTGACGPCRQDIS